MPDSIRPVIIALKNLSAIQQKRLAEWLPALAVGKDHSWALGQTTVLEVACGEDRYIVKAAEKQDHHLRRELRAHQEWLGPWTSAGRAPSLAYVDLDAGILVTRFLGGNLVLGTRYVHEPDTYRQAGELLAILHQQKRLVDPEYETQENHKALSWLDRPHRISAEVERRLRREVVSWETIPATLVPTHGDWHPRNWLVDNGQIRAIDFGRAALRPATTDFERLAVQEFKGHPELESAFFDGYGADPREDRAWRRQAIRAAISTTVWAHQVGDELFEAQGHTMIADVLTNMDTHI